LALVLAPGSRGASAGPAATLTIGRDVTEVRLQVTVRAPDYDAYRVTLRRIGGDEVARRDDLAAPADRSDLAFTIEIPAARLMEGDHLVTLQGRRGRGSFEDASQAIVRVLRPRDPSPGTPAR
jgi:hypothetical protein